MGCLNPDKNISAEAKQVLKSLGVDTALSREEIAQKTGFDTPLVARKVRELQEKDLITSEADKYVLTDKGKEALAMLDKKEE